MDKDIFIRKLKDKGYYYLQNNNGDIIYYPFTFKDESYTLQSSLIKDLKYSSTNSIFIFKFSKEIGQPEIKIAEIICRGLDELEEAINYISQHIHNNNSIEPFTEIIVKENLKIVKHRRKWMLK